MKSKPRKPKAAPKRSAASIRKASMADMEAFYSMKFQHYVAELDGETLGMGTLSMTNGRLWGWLDVKEGLSPKQRLAMVWALIRGLRRVGQPVYVTSNEGVHKRALDLLKAVERDRRYLQLAAGLHRQEEQVAVHAVEDLAVLAAGSAQVWNQVLE